MELILQVNDVDLTPIAIDARTDSRNTGGTIVTSMEAELRCNLELLRYVDLRGRVLLKVVREGQIHSVFAGLIIHASPEENKYVLKCRDQTQLLHEVKAGGGFGHGLSPAEIVFYLASKTDPEGVDPRNFHLKDGETLADSGLVTRRRRFVYIAPLPSCTLQAGVGTIKMANSWIYTVSKNPSADDRIISGFESDDPLWKSCETRVRFYVQATNFLEALAKGQNRLQRLLDVLSFGAGYASATFPTPAGPRPFIYDRQRHLVVIQETEWAFLRDTYSSDRYWMHWDAPPRHHDSFALIQQDPILSLYEIFQDLAEQDDAGLSSRERALLNALHALRQCRESIDTKDALDHVWRCMEFLLAGYVSRPLFSDTERSAILSAAKEALQEKQMQSESSYSEEQQQRLQNIVSQQLNQTPLRTKWKLFCQAHGLVFPEDDEKFLWALRRNRNDHQHGRSTLVSRHDIDRAATMMGNALISAVVANEETIHS